MRKLVILQTKCGCQRRINIDGAEHIYRVPVLHTTRLPFRKVGDEVSQEKVHRMEERVFEWNGLIETVREGEEYQVWEVWEEV